MKVFLSWSGERSQALAQALREWLPLVVHFADPWLSQSDIEAGERWATKVAKELEASIFGILAITRENIGSPWILFEAGALAKSMEEGRVIPLLLDLDFKDITGPLAQFQAKKVERSGIVEVVGAINRLAEQPVPEARLTQLLELAWPQLERQVAAIPKNPTVAKHNRPQSEVLEELVASVRGLDARLGDSLHFEERRFRRPRRHDTRLFLDAMRSLESEPGDPIVLVVLASMLRDDLPWLHELSMEVYRALTAGDSQRANQIIMRLHGELRRMRRGPLLASMSGSEGLYLAVKEATHFLEFQMREGTVRARSNSAPETKSSADAPAEKFLDESRDD